MRTKGSHRRQRWISGSQRWSGCNGRLQHRRAKELPLIKGNMQLSPLLVGSLALDGIDYHHQRRIQHHKTYHDDNGWEVRWYLPSMLRQASFFPTMPDQIKHFKNEYGVSLITYFSCRYRRATCQIQKWQLILQFIQSNLSRISFQPPSGITCLLC